MTAKVKIAISVVFIALLILVLSLTAALISSTNKQHKLNQSLENIYQKNIFGLLNAVEEMEIQLDKITVSNDQQIQRLLLHDVSKEALVACESLSNLPSGHKSLVHTTNFMNETGNYSLYIAQKLLNGDTLQEDDRNHFEKLHTFCQEVRYDLVILTRKILTQKFSLVKTLGKDKSGNSIFDKNFIDLKNLMQEAPVINYNSEQEIKGLPQTLCNKDEAEITVKEIFKNEGIKKVTFLGDTRGALVTFNFEVQTNHNGVLFVQIAQRGKFLLQFTRLYTQEEGELTDAECFLKAENFAKNAGLINLKTVWSNRTAGCIYINLVPITDGIVYYPDQIVVKVCTSTGLILGWDAKNYAYHHTERTLPAPAITAQQAQSKVFSGMTLRQTRLAVILNNLQEVLVYEIVCDYKGNQYFIYIHARTGGEEKILKIVSNAEGSQII